MRVQPLAAVHQITVPPVNVAAELAADERNGNPAPLRFAVPHQVQLSPAVHGTWEPVPGGRVWRLRIHSAGATDLNLGFSEFQLPAGATLHIASESENYIQGPYDVRDNKPHQQLWTPVVPGDRAVLELFVPDGADLKLPFVISQISSGYRDMFHRKEGEIPKQGNCNIDVICPPGAPWTNEIRSVARYSIGGSGLCTGTLVNNAAGDGKPYFLTANHCGINGANASTLVIYWNYQSPTCGQLAGGSLAQNQSGAIYRASRADVDMALVELEEIPEPSFNVYYSGWDRTTNTSVPGVVGIHHPSGDEKAISFSSNNVTVVNNCIGVTGISTHYNVVWTLGVTEPGSSGSGIWTHDTKRLVGFLSGGGSACNKPNLADCYGRFSVAWNGSSGSTRLRDWLDPQSSAPLSLPGLDPKTLSIILSSGGVLAGESCAPTNGVIDPGESVTVNLSIRNVGGLNASNVIGTLEVSGGVTSPGPSQNFGTLLASGPSVSRPFTFIATGACGGVLTARMQVQSGTNNLGTFAYTFGIGTPITTFTQRFDSVTAPALPFGWVNSATDSPGWSTVTTSSHSSPNSAFAPDPADISDASLTSPAIPIVNSNAQVSFFHRFDLEDGFDGGVLEISILGDPFTDIVTAGGSFAANGYNGVIPDTHDNPLADRSAWTGNSGTFVNTIANLPPSAAGKTVQLRWRIGTDDSVSDTGWFVDTVSIYDGYTCCSGIPAPVITNVTRTATDVAFSFETVLGATYISEVRTNLSTNNVWSPFHTNIGDGTLKTVTNTTPSNQRYIRIRAQ